MIEACQYTSEVPPIQKDQEPLTAKVAKKSREDRKEKLNSGP